MAIAGKSQSDGFFSAPGKHMKGDGRTIILNLAKHLADL